MEVPSGLLLSISEMPSYLQDLKWCSGSLEGNERPRKQRDHSGSSHIPTARATFCYCGMILFPSFLWCIITAIIVAQFWTVINGDDFRLQGQKHSGSPQTRHKLPTEALTGSKNETLPFRCLSTNCCFIMGSEKINKI